MCDVIDYGWVLGINATFKYVSVKLINFYHMNQIHNFNSDRYRLHR